MKPLITLVLLVAASSFGAKLGDLNRHSYIAGGTMYPIFNIPMIEGSVSYEELELKCSTNNFAVTECTYEVTGDVLPLVGEKNGRAHYYLYKDVTEWLEVHWNGTAWSFEYNFIHGDSINTGGGLGYYPNGDSQVDWSVNQGDSIAYYFDTFQADLAGYNSLTFSDQNCNVYFTDYGSMGTRRSLQTFDPSLTMSGQIDPTYSPDFLIVSPDADSFPWMTPDNPNLTWVFSRRDAVTGAEKQNGETHWHAIEPIWKPYRK